MCVCSNLYPLVFIAGSHGVRLVELPYASNREATCGLVEPVGPTSLLGRPGWSAYGPRAPTAPNFFHRAVLGHLLSEHQGTTCPKWVWCGLELHLVRFEPESVL